MRYIVFGNGIVGMSSAFGLMCKAGENDEIVIVGRSSRIGSATLAAAAMLNSFAEIEAGGLDSEIDIYRFELSHQATRMWPKFELALIDAAGEKLPQACSRCQGCAGGGCFKSGTYVVNNTAADDLDDENFDAILSALELFNEQHDLISPRDIPGYKPSPRYRATRAVMIHNEGWFNPRVMVDKMEGALRRSSKVRFLDTNLDHLVCENGAISGGRLEDGSVVTGDRYLLASGASATDVIARSNLDLPIQRVFYGIGTSLEIQSRDAPLSNCIRTPNRGLACGLYAAPYFWSPDLPLDHVLVGASNFISPTLHLSGRLTSVETLVSGAMRQINTDFYRADLIRVNVGARPNPQDTYPMLGRTAIENLFIATGTKRDGFHMAPVISEMMSAVMRGEPVDPRFDQFRPDRKLIKSLTREQAIEKAVRHQMNAAYQHGFQPAANRMPDQIAQSYRDQLNYLHDQVGAFDWGIPPEMLDMYRYGHAMA